MNDPAIDRYTVQLLQSVFGNLPALVTNIAVTRNLSSSEAIEHIVDSIKKMSSPSPSPQAAAAATSSESEIIQNLRAEIKFIKTQYNERYRDTVNDRNILRLRELETNRLRAEVSRLNDEIKTLQDDLQSSQDLGNDETNRLKDTIESLKKDLERSSKTLHDKEKELANLREESEKKLICEKEKCYKYQNDIKELEKSLSKRDKSIKTNNESLLKLVRIVNPEVSDSDKVYDTLKSYINDYKDKLRIVTELENMERENMNHIRKLIESMDKLVALSSEFQESSSSSSSSSLTPEETALQNIEDITKRLNKIIQALPDVLAASRLEIDDPEFVKRLDEYIKKDEKLQELLDKRVMLERNNEILHLKNEINELNGQLKDSKNDRERLDGIRIDLEQKIASQEHELEDLRKNKESDVSRIKDLEKEIHERKIELENYQQQIEDYRNLESNLRLEIREHERQQQNITDAQVDEALRILPELEQLPVMTAAAATTTTTKTTMSLTPEIENIIREKDNQIEYLRQELTSYKDYLVTNASSDEKQLNNVETMDIVNKLNDANQEIVRLTEERDKLLTDARITLPIIIEYQKHIQKQLNKIEELTKEVSKLRTTNDELNMKIDSLNCLLEGKSKITNALNHAISVYKSQRADPNVVQVLMAIESGNIKFVDEMLIREATKTINLLDKVVATSGSGGGGASYMPNIETELQEFVKFDKKRRVSSAANRDNFGYGNRGGGGGGGSVDNAVSGTKRKRVSSSPSNGSKKPKNISPPQLQQPPPPPSLTDVKKTQPITVSIPLPQLKTSPSVSSIPPPPPSSSRRAERKQSISSKKQPAAAAASSSKRDEQRKQPSSKSDERKPVKRISSSTAIGGRSSSSSSSGITKDRKMFTKPIGKTATAAAAVPPSSPITITLASSPETDTAAESLEFMNRLMTNNETNELPVDLSMDQGSIDYEKYLEFE
jgi:chromosome segregation ATPase